MKDEYFELIKEYEAAIKKVKTLGDAICEKEAQYTEEHDADTSEEVFDLCSDMEDRNLTASEFYEKIKKIRNNI